MENNPVAPQQPIPMEQQPQMPPVQPPKSKKLSIIIGIIIVGVVLLVAVLIMVFMSNNSPKININPTPTTATPTVTPPPITELPEAIVLTLEKGKQIQIPNSDNKITYVGADIPNPNCADCSTTTDLLLVSKESEKKLHYLCGGIAGACDNLESAFGMQIELVTTTKTSATVKIHTQ